MKLEDIKQGFNSFWDTLSDGWQHLRHSASTALTGFRSSESTNLPGRQQVDDMFYMPAGGWAMLGGNVFEDDKRIVVHLEMPGLEKDDLDIEVQEGNLVVRGEKRFEREQTEGRYRVLQCAYGSFRRAVPLHASVIPDQAQANYRNGVLRVELPKAEVSKPHKVNIRVD